MSEKKCIYLFNMSEKQHVFTEGLSNSLREPASRLSGNVLVADLAVVSRGGIPKESGRHGLLGWNEATRGLDGLTRLATTRALRALNRAGIKNIDQLRRTPREELEAIAGIGTRGADFIEVVFQEKE